MKSILLIGDMINDIVHPDGPNKYGEELARRNTIANTAAVIAKARAAGVAIGYIRVGFSSDYRECPPTSKIFQGAKKNGIFKLDTWGTEVHPDLAPQDGDFDIVKHRVSPFYDTDLEPLLKAQGVERIYICGVSTGGVVMSVAKEGHDRDYQIVIIDDCCCAGSEDEHRYLLNNMARFADVTTSQEITF
ncbi:MAG: cysteine hydrolase [Rhodospirillales bacterium]